MWLTPKNRMPGNRRTPRCPWDGSTSWARTAAWAKAWSTPARRNLWRQSRKKTMLARPCGSSSTGTARARPFPRTSLPNWTRRPRASRSLTWCRRSWSGQNGSLTPTAWKSLSRRPISPTSLMSPWRSAPPATAPTPWRSAPIWYPSACPIWWMVRKQHPSNAPASVT